MASARSTDDAVRATGQARRLRSRRPGPGEADKADLMLAVTPLGRSAASWTSPCRPPAPGCGSEGEPLCADCRPALDARLALPPGHAARPGGGAAGAAAAAGVVLAVRGRHAARPARAQVRRGAAAGGSRSGARSRRAGGSRGPAGICSCPVPVHAARRRERGYDQAELIAAVAAEALGLPWRAALVRSRATVAQYRLDRRHRASETCTTRSSSVRGPRPAVAGRWVVLVDDIVTTGRDAGRLRRRAARRRVQRP